jgi:hypothetical protein
MERNLYAPPAAPVADPTEIRQHRPKLVEWAVWSLWVSVAIGIVTPVLQYTVLFTVGSVLLVLVGNVIRYTLAGWIIIRIGQGRHWARILLVLWDTVGLVSIAYQWQAYRDFYLARPMWLGAAAATKLVLDYTAAVLLFTPPANRWFKPPRPAADLAPPGTP